MKEIYIYLQMDNANRVIEVGLSHLADMPRPDDGTRFPRKPFRSLEKAREAFHTICGKYPKAEHRDRVKILNPAEVLRRQEVREARRAKARIEKTGVYSEAFREKARAGRQAVLESKRLEGRPVISENGRAKIAESNRKRKTSKGE